MGIFKIELDKKVKDQITGFSGIVTARAEYITGCRQYLVSPRVKNGDFREGQWFDEDRLLKSSSKENDGGPQQNTAPKK